MKKNSMLSHSVVSSIYLFLYQSEFYMTQNTCQNIKDLMIGILRGSIYHFPININKISANT